MADLLQPVKSPEAGSTSESRCLLRLKDYLLLVDDDHAIHFLSRRLIVKLGYDSDIYEASNGIEALQIIDTYGPPTLTLLDLRMPLMDGYEFLHALEEKGLKEHCPIAVMTSSSREDDRAQATSFSNVLAYLDKPLCAETFNKVLSSLTQKAS